MFFRDTWRPSYATSIERHCADKTELDDVTRGAWDVGGSNADLASPRSIEVTHEGGRVVHYADDILKPVHASTGCEDDDGVVECFSQMSDVQQREAVETPADLEYDRISQMGSNSAELASLHDGKSVNGTRDTRSLTQTSITGVYEQHLIKLLMLGDSNAGKAELMNRFCTDRTLDTFTSTVGVDFKWKELERHGRMLKVQIWDLAGQERFRSIIPSYYRCAMGVIVCFDLTDRVSFGHIEYWLRQMSECEDKDVQMIIVATNLDQQCHRQVSEEEGIALASLLGVSYFEASAATGAGVEAPFHHIIDLIIEERFGMISPDTMSTADTEASKPHSGSRSIKHNMKRMFSVKRFLPSKHGK
eukprot:TRINITY_DN33990_c0_g1_i1.p1 TRINITY_DN33990_c0_g1~~TRINITY_DN33990_c0_g1_i1.p1  ORF type:complete len:360 (-),score=44.71 TRINITY_DN33990_c0_g1_i1:305-1384(-)